MKKTILYFVVCCCALGLTACNTADGGSGGGPAVTDVTWTVDYLLDSLTGTDYPGGEIDLTGQKLLDISKYQSVTVNATLYSDAEGKTVAVKTNASDNLAQFKILKATGGWDDPDNICGPAGNNTKYNMTVDGDTTWTVPKEASGVPGKLLLQANWADFTDGIKVKSIKVNSITFKAKTGEVVWEDNALFKLGNSDNYPGAEVDLSELNLLDISSYGSVTVNATLYSDEEGTTVAVKTNASDNLAQFKLLKATGGWNDADNICGTTKYNMNVDGDTTWTVPSGATGSPTKLLIQANWAEFPNAVKSIRVHTINFAQKTGDPVLGVVYPEDGSKITVVGNEITFIDAMYSDAAAIVVFPSTWTPAKLAGKSLVIDFTIPSHTPKPSSGSATIGVEHQIHIQAANSDKSSFNGQNPPDHGNVGQKYITLNDAATTGWDGTSGSFSVSLNDLLAAAAVTEDANDCKGPFVLDAIRICNNGTTWNEGATTHVRCKSYTLVIDSVTVQ